MSTSLKHRLSSTALLAVLGLLLSVCVKPGAVTAPPVRASAEPEEEAGSLQGHLSVDARGAAVYTVQLEVPPGTADLQPQLTLLYSSHLQNGLLGMGFSLGGMSSLRRCGATLAQNGANSAVSFSPSDRLCLDGGQLQAVEGAYWAPGTVYRTEKDGGSRITARPDGAFLVQQREGQTHVYGGTPDSRAVSTANPTQVRAWALSEVRDLHGNRMLLRYTAGAPGSGQSLPEVIEYTSHVSAPLAQLRRIRFTYDFSRPDVEVAFVGGGVIRNTARLTGVASFLVDANGTERLVTRHALGYTVAPDTGRSLLSTLTECAADGACLPTQRFTWQHGTLGVASPQHQGDYAFGTGSVQKAWRDFDNDGRPDLLVASTQTQGAAWLVRNEQGTLSRRNETLGTFQCAGGAVHWMDFNADGYTDLVCTPTGGDLRHWYRPSNGRVLLELIPLGTARCEGGAFTWTDFDGDALPDLVCDEAGGAFEHTLWRNDGRKLLPPTPLGRYGLPNARAQWEDFNGDRMSDLLVSSRDARPQHWVLLSDGKRLGGARALGALGDETSTFSWEDLNGDGLPDLIADRTRPPFTHLARLSTGVALEPAVRALGTFPQSGPSFIGGFTWRDFNEDGMADLLCCGESAAEQGWSVLLSRGDSLQRPLPLPGTRFAPGGSEPAWNDFTADGLVDLLVAPHGSSGGVYLLQHPSTYPDLLTGIANGLGGTTTLAYRPITDASVYESSPVTPASYPVRELHGPLYVLAHKQVNDGRLHPDTYRFRYGYAGSRLDLRGRGWLGFRELRALDENLGTETRSTFGQDFPLTGVMLERRTLQRGKEGPPRLLEREQHTYAVTQPFAGVSRVLESDSSLTQYGPAGEADVALTQARHIDHDRWGNEILIHDRGNVATPADDAFICGAVRNETAGAVYVLGLLELETQGAACRFDAKAETCACDDRLRQTRTEFTDDGTFSVRARHQYDSVRGDWFTLRYTYDVHGNVTRIENPAKGPLTLTYDEAFKTFRTTSTNALGHVSRTEYDPAFGVPVRAVDENGTVREYRYNGFGQVTAVLGEDPEGKLRPTQTVRRVQTGEVGQGGEVYTETRSRVSWSEDDPEKWPASRAYFDGLNRRYRTEHTAPGQARAIRTERLFDGQARVEAQSTASWEGDPVNYVRMAYDARGRLASRTSPSGSVTRLDYDLIASPLDGGRTLLTRTVQTRGYGTPEARSAEQWLDSRGLLRGERYKDGAQVAYVYDPLSRLLRVEAPNGVSTRIDYSSLDVHTRVQSSDSGALSNTFYDNALLRTQTDAAGGSFTLEYDVLGRIRRKSVRAAGSAPGSERVTEYRYDEPSGVHPIGRLTSATVLSAGKAVAAYAFAYDAEGHKTDQWVTVGEQRYHQAFTYDAGGRLIDTVQPDGGGVRRAYTPEGFLASLSVKAPGSADFLPYVTYGDFTADGLPGRVTFRNGTSVQRTYDVEGRILTEEMRVGATVVDARGYKRDAVGDLTAVTDPRDGRVLQSFEYHPQGYLKSATKPGAAGTPWTFAYDAAGNLTRQDDVTYNYTGQRLMSGERGGQRVLSAEYDAAGNPVKRVVGGQTWAYAYDGEGRLVRAQRGSREATFTYGLEGHRLERRDFNGTRSLYVFPDWEVTVLGDGTRLTTTVLQGLLGREATLTRREQGPQAGPVARSDGQGLTPGPNGSGIPVEGTLFFAGDLLGSTRMVTDEAGQEVGRVAYAPYGSVVQAESRGRDVFRAKYVGSELDADTGFNYMGERYQDAAVGRFLTPDNRPVGTNADSAAALNRYAYAGNSPVGNKDPSGAFFLIDDAIEIGVAVAAAEGVAAAVATAEVAEATTLASTVTAEVAAAGAAVSSGVEVAQFGWAAPAAAAGLSGGGELAAMSVETAGAAVADLAAADAVGLEAGANLVGVAEGALSDAVGFAANPAELAEVGLTGEAQGALLEGIGAQAGYGAEEAGLGGAGESLPELTEAQGIGRGAPTSGFEEGTDTLGSRPSLSEVECNCFPRGTRVRAERGPVPIEELKLGERVWSYDVGTGAPVIKPITGLVRKQAEGLVRVSLRGHVLESTPEHALWVVGEGWTPAERLQPGQALLGLDGSSLVIDALERVRGPVEVFTLEIAGTHDFFVGVWDALVHNVCQLNGQWGTSNRLERVRARVRPGDLNTGTGTTRTTRAFVQRLAQNDGYVGSNDAGHPIARALGGPGNDTRYIFPQNPSINRGAFRVFEGVIRNEIRATGRSARIRLKLYYRNAQSTRPYQIRYRYRLSGGNWTTRYFAN